MVGDREGRKENGTERLLEISKDGVDGAHPFFH